LVRGAGSSRRRKDLTALVQITTQTSFSFLDDIQKTEEERRGDKEEEEDTTRHDKRKPETGAPFRSPSVSSLLFLSHPHRRGAIAGEQKHGHKTAPPRQQRTTQHTLSLHLH
jgi:hypothetical protein